MPYDLADRFENVEWFVEFHGPRVLLLREATQTFRGPAYAGPPLWK
jgi:hypothetical protein